MDNTSDPAESAVEPSLTVYDLLLDAFAVSVSSNTWSLAILIFSVLPDPIVFLVTLTVPALISEPLESSVNVISAGAVYAYDSATV